MCYVVIGWELIGSELFYFSSAEFCLVDVRYYSSFLMLCSLFSLNYTLLILSSVFFSYWVGWSFLGYFLYNTYMLILRLSYVRLLEVVVGRFRLPFHSYLCEVSGNGSILASRTSV
jgi:hypothetical protein